MFFKLAKTCAIVGSVLVAAITRRPKHSGESTLLVAEELRFPSISGSARQFTAMNGPLLRRLCP